MAGVREWRENFGDFVENPDLGNPNQRKDSRMHGLGGPNNTSPEPRSGIFNSILDLLSFGGGGGGAPEELEEVERLLSARSIDLDDPLQEARFHEADWQRRQAIETGRVNDPDHIDAVSRAAPPYSPNERYINRMRRN